MIGLLDMELEVIGNKISNSPHIYDKLDEIEEPIPLLQSDFKWTTHPIHLVEIIESILELKCINNGDVLNDEFYSFVGKVLNVNLSKHSGKLYKIRHRGEDINGSKDRIRFITMMHQALSNRMEVLDNKR